MVLDGPEFRASNCEYLRSSSTSLRLRSRPNLIVPQRERPRPPVHALVHPTCIAHLRPRPIAPPCRGLARPAIAALGSVVLAVRVRSARRLVVHRDQGQRALLLPLVEIEPARVAQRLVRPRVAAPQGRRRRVAVRTLLPLAGAVRRVISWRRLVQLDLGDRR